MHEQSGTEGTSQDAVQVSAMFAFNSLETVQRAAPYTGVVLVALKSFIRHHSGNAQATMCDVLTGSSLFPHHLVTCRRSARSMTWHPPPTTASSHSTSEASTSVTLPQGT
jgi:hypothetical protein